MPTTATPGSVADSAATTSHRGLHPIPQHDEVDRLVGPVTADLVADRVRVGGVHAVHRLDQVTRQELAVRRTADRHRGDRRQLLDRLTGRPQGRHHGVVLGGLHHLGLGLGDLVGAAPGREHRVARQGVATGQPVRRQRLRQGEPGVGAGAGHDGQVELARGRERRHALDRDQRPAVDVAEHVGRPAGTPGHERHRQDRQRHRQGHEQQRRHQGGPGLPGHAVLDPRVDPGLTAA